jgi:hypothetical protein
MVPIVLYFQLLSQFLFPVILNVIEAIWGGNRQINIKPDFS